MIWGLIFALLLGLLALLTAALGAVAAQAEEYGQAAYLAMIGLALMGIALMLLYQSGPGTDVQTEELSYGQLHRAN